MADQLHAHHPTPTQPCLTVVILNWLRPDNIKGLILPELTQSDLVGEIIISHGRPDTQFNCYSKKVNIKHRQDWDNNTKYGLGLRFQTAQEAQYPLVLFLDDDIVVYPVTLLNMVKAFRKNPLCLVGRYGRSVNKDLSYNSLPISQGDLSAPLALTSLLLVPKGLCLVFLETEHLVWDYVSANSRPLWNGEDIYISILSMLQYGKWPIIVDDDKYFPVEKLRSPEDLKVAISGQDSHVPYRTGLIRHICQTFKISPKLLFTDPSEKRPTFI